MLSSFRYSDLPNTSRYLQISVGFLVVFVIATWIAYWKSPGHDLASGYFACRLMATGNQTAIYAHDPEYFHIVDHAVWQTAASEVGFTGFLHPYVQIPLWAASLRPLCMSMTFEAFNSLFVLLNAIAVAGIIWLSTRWLNSSMTAPLVIFGISLWLWVSYPFQYAMDLTQTHPLFLLAALGSLMCAERQKAHFAGILLAIAAVIKITPALLVVYWVFSRKWEAIIWFCIAVIGFLFTSVALAGIELHIIYITELRRISNILLISLNNVSFASFIMGYYYPEEIIGFRMFPLPTWLKLVSTGLALLIIALAGRLRWFAVDEGATVSIALIGMTTFAPIAWSHYYIVLMVPLVYLIGHAVKRRAVWIITLMLVFITLVNSASLIRPLFWVSIIALISCVILAISKNHRDSSVQATQ